MKTLQNFDYGKKNFKYIWDLVLDMYMIWMLTSLF